MKMDFSINRDRVQKQDHCNRLKKVTMYIICALLLLGTYLFSGCNSYKKLETLNIGLMADEGAIPFLIAKEKGFFEKEGLNVNISVFNSAIERDDAVESGGLEGTMGDMLSVLLYREDGKDLKMVSAVYGNYRMVSAPNLTEDTLKALDEITIGLSTNTVIDYTTETIARFKGFDSKLKPIVIPQLQVRLEMLGSDEINGATLPEPLASAALLDGGESVGSSQDFGLYPAIFMITNQSLEEKKVLWTKFFKAYNRAVTSINDGSVNVDFNLLIDRLSFPYPLKESFRLPVYLPASSPDQSTFEDISQWLLEKQLIEEEIIQGEVQDISILPNK